jgi:hypothetical protein
MLAKRPGIAYVIATVMMCAGWLREQAHPHYDVSSIFKICCFFALRHNALGDHPRRQDRQRSSGRADAYKQALIARDAAALSKVLSDDLTYTHSSNKHEDKAAVLSH